jgi:hypothetical protein
LIRRAALAVVMAALALTAFTTMAAVKARPAGAAGSTPGYWLVGSDGGIFSFGGTPFYGSAGSLPLRQPIVGMAATADGGGYWLVAADGGVFTYGDAQFHGSTGSLTLNRAIVGMATTPDGGGYWLVASDGGIFSFGDAQFHGSMGGKPLNQPVVGMAATADGGGYWLVASDGGIFSFGDAQFHGSMGGTPLNKPVIGMITGPSGLGYFLIASDGGMFTFGTAPFFGSLGGVPLRDPIVAAATTPSKNGYWLTDSHGVVWNFGAAGYFGSAPAPLNRPIVGMAEGPGNGSVGGNGYTPGSFGYDVSVFQCGNLPTGPHQIGIVQVDGASSAATNPCLAQEAAWAGAGLNLYTFLTYQTTPTPAPGCGGDQACNAGFAAAIHAFFDAVAAGVRTNVSWWLDVEPANWSGNTAENAIFVQGAINALRGQGVGNVGIYASPGVWNSIVGSYQPPVPYWMADWTGSGPASCAQYPGWAARAQLPAGPLEIVQYQSNTYDDDYAC